MLRRFSYLLGGTVRESGQALDRLGAALQGNYAYKEQLCRHRRVMGLYDSRPSISSDVFIAPDAAVIGNVQVGEGASLWYGAVLRGDVNSIKIGKKSSIGNRTVVHSSGGNVMPASPAQIGDNVVVGDGVVLHGCTLQNECKVEDGAVVYDGVVVEKNAIVGPGAVVTAGKRVVSGQYWAGNPAKPLRDVTPEEAKAILELAEYRYTQAKAHEKEMLKSAEEKEVDIVAEEQYTSVRPGTRIER
jgi:carbonic anhydrase/acetyltransferase-like protein (isoleucine patch superfamily)